MRRRFARVQNSCWHVIMPCSGVGARYDCIRLKFHVSGKLTVLALAAELAEACLALRLTTKQRPQVSLHQAAAAQRS